ncbi:hypothetical protein EJV46_20895 [Roseococcus sp. SYP-B2431]|uniref:2-keto-4-pentenoate hydratase n=1 Tax=Roseococcus sp. SYP-B2431 TaxID=2496640 RepID=UPI0010391436|nr:fumarylacetoacetate hydrolase family protein [Roseococcus sp. SYP-B2431]TCH96439.1 hypothetical protein EJV46_20895 [Roseococcus sp. SYP-B2431]
MDEGLRTLSRALWEARRTGRSVESAGHRLPLDRDEAYAVQREVIALSGSAPCGYKIGSTSAEAQRILGTTEPGAGRLVTSFTHASPARLPIAAAHGPAVEGEFAFRLGRDLPARVTPYAPEDISAAIEAVAGAIEMVGSRFAGGLGQQGRLLTTADSSAHIGLVTGPWHPWRRQDLRPHRVEMFVDGIARGSGTGARALGDPLNVLAWLVRHLSAQGQGLLAGEIVATGTCTGLDPVTPGGTATADFGTLGRVEIAFTAFDGA